MFKFLRDKLKKGISNFSKEIEEKGEEVEQPIEKASEEKEIRKDEKEVKQEETKKSETAKEEDSKQDKESEKIKQKDKEEPGEEPEKSEEIEKKSQEEAKKEPVELKSEEEKPKKGFFKKFFSKKKKEEPGEEPGKSEEIEKKSQEEAKKEESEQSVIGEIEKSKEETIETPEKEEVKKTVVEKKEEPGEKAPQQEGNEKEDTDKEHEKETIEEAKAPEEKPKKQGFFQKIGEKVVSKKINEDKFDELFFELEVSLLENNVAVQVIEKIKQDLKEEIVGKPIRRNQIETTILTTLKDSIEEVLSSKSIDILKNIEQKKPYVICFVGVNGSGKTTSIAKVAKMLKDHDKTVVLGAADTFRAAAIDQLQIHADKLGVKMIKHDYGSDPAAVAFDAVKYAKTKDMDVVLIDTAGRLHSNSNLVDQMKKIIRVAQPDLKIFVGESITGNDCTEQAIKFNEAIDIDGVILSKADIDEKGGAPISVSYVTNKPILYMGTGQEYQDLKAFDKQEVMKNLGLEA